MIFTSSCDGSRLWVFSTTCSCSVTACWISLRPSSRKRCLSSVQEAWLARILWSNIVRKGHLSIYTCFREIDLIELWLAVKRFDDKAELCNLQPCKLKIVTVGQVTSECSISFCSAICLANRMEPVVIEKLRCHAVKLVHCQCICCSKVSFS